MHIVLAGARPDESFASGTIAKHVDRGHRATIVVATRGGRGHWNMEPEKLMRTRSEEMRREAEILGTDVVFMLPGRVDTRRRQAQGGVRGCG